MQKMNFTYFFSSFLQKIYVNFIHLRLVHSISLIKTLKY